MLSDVNGSITINVSGGTGVVSTLWLSNNFSSNDEDIFNLPSGAYSLHIEDQNLCFKDTTFMIIEPDSLYSIHSVQNATCYSYSDGMIDLTIQGGTVPYLINWSNILSNSLNVDSLSAGDYIYFIVDSNGCSFSDTAIINHPDEIIILDSIVDVMCFGYHSGIIDLSVSGGTLPYSYVWSNGDSTQDLYNIKSDSYNVLVTDNNGCFDTDNFVVSQPLFPITFQIDGEDVLCFGGSTGSADLSVSGGTVPYLYSWNNAEITQDINDLVAGIYVVTIIDDNGCDTTGSVDILENANILTNYNTNDVLCFGDTTGVIDIVNTSGGTPPFSYDFSNGFSSSVPSSLFVPSGLYSLLVTDINMCTESIQFLISEPSQMSSNITFENIDCFGNVNGSIDLSVSGGVVPYTYLWSNNESFEDISNLPSGSYSVIITDSNNCQISDSANISQPLEIVVSAQVSDAICHGNSDGFIDLSASGGTGTLSYLWSNGSVSEDIFNVSSGFYSVDVIDVNNCIFSQSYLVSEPLAYLPFFDVMDVMCYGDATGSVNLTISGNNPPYSYIWDNGSNTEDVSNLLAGEYSVTVTDVNNCIEIFDVSIVQPTELILQYTVYDATCEENNDGSILTNVSGGTFPYAYFWSNGLYDSDLYNLSKGIYSLEIRDANSCIYPIENIEVSFDGFDGCIEIPTGFTPNGDGIHDEWAI